MQLLEHMLVSEQLIYLTTARKMSSWTVAKDEGPYSAARQSAIDPGYHLLELISCHFVVD